MGPAGQHSTGDGADDSSKRWAVRGRPRSSLCVRCAGWSRRRNASPGERSGPAEPTGHAASPGSGHSLMAALRHDAQLRASLIAVLGASSALGDHLVANPDEAFAAGAITEDPAALEFDATIATEPSGPTIVALRNAYRRALLRIAAADLTGAADVEATMTSLTHLAVATLRASFTLAGGTEETRLAVIAMGKCGGGELNYVSDVDVIYVCSDAASRRRPRNADSTRLSAGHSAPQSSLAATDRPHATQPTPVPPRVTSQPKPAELSSNTKLSPSNTPTDKPGEDALGSGDVNIALAQFFPHRS